MPRFFKKIMEKSYISYLKSIGNPKIDQLVGKYESGTIDFTMLSGSINPVLFEGVISYYVFVKDKRMDDLLQ